VKLVSGKLTYLLAAISLGLPALLIFHGVFSAREIHKMRVVFLRDRAATLAARLETLPAAQLNSGNFEELFESDPALLGIHVYLSGQADSSNPALESIRSGRELYRTEEIRGGGREIFRAYIPFHAAGEVYIAQIDLSPAAPDFVLVHAQHNLELAVVSGTVLLFVSLTAIWSLRRAARLERRKMETERLAELGSLSAVLAHEIRNPLGTVKGFAQLAAEGADPGTRKPLDAIVRECGRLESLVNSLLLYGRPVTPEIRSTEWQSLEPDLAGYAAHTIGDRPIEFRSESQIRSLPTDGPLLKQALFNLIRNSVEAIPDGHPGKIRLRATPAPGDEIVISVEDDGPGLPEAVRAKLFAPFVTTKAAGSGLGLPISKKVVEALGGTLRLQAVAPHGTRAELCLHGTNSGH
jgi:two-component system sensor histidine kinase HydH